MPLTIVDLARDGLKGQYQPMGPRRSIQKTEDNVYDASSFVDCVFHNGYFGKGKPTKEQDGGFVLPGKFVLRKLQNLVCCFCNGGKYIRWWSAE
jgi:hypothetical protein